MSLTMIQRDTNYVQNKARGKGFGLGSSPSGCLWLFKFLCQVQDVSWRFFLPGLVVSLIFLTLTVLPLLS